MGVSAGGSTDVSARRIAQRLSERLGQSGVADAAYDATGIVDVITQQLRHSAL